MGKVMLVDQDRKKYEAKKKWPYTIVTMEMGQFGQVAIWKYYLEGSEEFEIINRDYKPRWAPGGDGTGFCGLAGLPKYL